MEFAIRSAWICGSSVQNSGAGSLGLVSLAWVLVRVDAVGASAVAVSADGGTKDLGAPTGLGV